MDGLNCILIFVLDHNELGDKGSGLGPGSYTTASAVAGCWDYLSAAENFILRTAMADLIYQYWKVIWPKITIKLFPFINTVDSEP